MGEFQDMQKYIAQCAGGEWDEHGSWSYDRNVVNKSHHTGLQFFLEMESEDEDLTPEGLQQVSSSLISIVNNPPYEGGLEGVAIRTRIREFARHCKEDART